MRVEPAGAPPRPTRVRGSLLPLLPLLLVAVTACGTEAGDPPAPAPPSDPRTLVLRVQELHSSPRPWDRGDLPRFSLYGGGHVIAPARTQGALRTAVKYRLTPARYRDLTDAAHAAGLAHARRHEDTTSTDASLLTVTHRTPDGLRSTRVTAPEAGGEGDRGRVLDFVRTRVPPAPSDTPPPGAAAYRPAALAILATGGVGADDATARPWPLRPIAGRCEVVTGEDLVRARQLALGARQNTRWSSGGTLYAVAFRPLLPDEHTCRDLDRP
ncbi:hypothetical protein ACWGH2_00645 [Streptomyces sp. NPDC054871]